ncbi:MAG TPA: hypothetical protein VFY90_13680 [Tepidiformaceae bacterium]|nr:hypothetical protein [Tepidiformaceae bacterium]
MLMDELLCEAKLADIERAIEAERARRQFERLTPLHTTPGRPAVRRWRFPGRAAPEGADR